MILLNFALELNRNELFRKNQHNSLLFSSPCLINMIFKKSYKEL